MTLLQKILYGTGVLLSVRWLSRSGKDQVPCPRCKQANSSDAKYCANCGQFLLSVPENFETHLKEQITTTLEERYKDKEMIAFESYKAATQSLDLYAKRFAIFAGIPLTLVGITFSGLGIKTYYEFQSKVNEATKPLETKVKNLENYADQVKVKAETLNNRLDKNNDFVAKLNERLKELETDKANTTASKKLDAQYFQTLMETLKRNRPKSP